MWNRLLLISFFLLLPVDSRAGTYWVSPTGASLWATCASATDPGENYCSTDTANVSVAAGDTVYLKGGTYTLAGGNDHDNGIAPETSGESGTVITFSAAAGETPIIDGSQTYHSGISLIGRNYIKIDGITFRDIRTWGGLSNSSYNEITNCTFGPATTEAAQNGFSIAAGSTHNWIHGNTFSKSLSSSGACAEGADSLRIGSGYAIGSVDPGNNYNTIENNVFANSAHTNFDNYGMYNIVRNNVAHNEPWITGCTDGQSGKEPNYDTSATSLTVGTGSKSLTVSTGKTYATSSPIGIISTASPGNAMSGTVSSYNSGTGALVVTVTYSIGSGTIDSWTLSKGNYPEYETASYAGKYGHRNFQVTDDYGRDGLFNLYESNRLGHASNNPGNGGPMNFDVAAPKNIIRYNAIFNGMSSGIYFKYASSDLTSAITSESENTIGEGELTFSISTGLHLVAGGTIRIWNTADKTKAMTGTVTSYTSGTGALVVNIDDTNGTGTYSAWQIFWNGASGGVNNRVYNNTLYHNGQGYDWRAYGNENMAYSGVGIGQVNGSGTGSTANVIKNNLLYDNGEGDICAADLYDAPCSAETWDTVSNNWLNADGDPLFVNKVMTDPTSTTLPNLSLQSSSTARDAGTSLTLANGAGNNTVTLIVDDALYFQDGTWGSSLSSIQADWIAIGTVGNMVQISSIDYATNTVTLSSAKTWADDAPIWLYKKSDGERVLYGDAPDYGAHEHNARGSGSMTGGQSFSGGTIR